MPRRRASVARVRHICGTVLAYRARMESCRRMPKTSHRGIAATMLSSGWILLGLTCMATACSAQSAPTAQLSAGSSAAADDVSGTSGVAGEKRTGRASFIANSLNGKKDGQRRTVRRHQARRSSSVVSARDDSPCDQSGERPCRRGQGGGSDGIARSAPPSHDRSVQSRGRAARLRCPRHRAGYD